MVINPVLVSAERFNAPERLVLTFDQNIDPLSDALPTQFTIPDLGPANQPSAYLDLVDNVLTLAIDWPAFMPPDIFLTYVGVPGQIAGADSGVLQPFSGFPIIA